MQPSNANLPLDEVSLMFEAARSFIGGAKIIIESEGIQDEGIVRIPTLPVIVCSAIAIEIGIKTIFQLNSLAYPKGDRHDLKLLFEYLPEALQLELLLFQICYTGVSAESAKKIIIEQKDTFKTWRYPYEKPLLKSDPAFLYHFSLALSDYIKSKTKIERSANGWKSPKALATE